MADQFLKFTDEDGDPIYMPNDIIGIFTKADKTTIGSMLTENLRTVKANEFRGILSQTTGQWTVRESYEDILLAIQSMSAQTKPACTCE